MADRWSAIGGALKDGDGTYVKYDDYKKLLDLAKRLESFVRMSFQFKIREGSVAYTQARKAMRELEELDS